MDSKIFDKFGNTEIGLWLEISVRDPFLNTGVTFASFRAVGYLPSLRQRLYRLDKITETGKRHSLRNFPDMSYMPPVFKILLISTETSSLEHG